MQENKILNENEKQANRIVAKVMLTTFFIFTMVYVLNILGVFVISDVVMTVAYIGSGILLLLPTLLTYVMKSEKAYIKYINVISAALFVMLISVTLTYHVGVIYVYPIAIASLYFSKRLNVFATGITVVGVSVGQILAFYLDTPKDDNFSDLYEVIVWGIIPRGMVLIAIAVIFTMLCTRTVALLTKLVDAVEGMSKYLQPLCFSSYSTI